MQVLAEQGAVSSLSLSPCPSPHIFHLLLSSMPFLLLWSSAAAALDIRHFRSVVVLLSAGAATAGQQLPHVHILRAVYRTHAYIYMHMYICVHTYICMCI